MAGLTIEGADKLRELAVKLKQADPKIRRELGKSLRPAVKTITGEIQDTVRSAPSQGRHGLAHERRAARTLALSRGMTDARAFARASKGEPELGGGVALISRKRRQARRAQRVAIADRAEGFKSALRAKQAAKAEAGAGLRETIARAVAGSVSTSSKSTGVSVTWKVAAQKMPNKQRNLPKGFNSPKGWRHPVFGNREVWVAQHGTPFFDPVIKKHRDELGRTIVDGMQRAADAIIHE